MNPKEVLDFLSEIGYAAYKMSPPFDRRIKAGAPKRLKEILARKQVSA